MDRKEREIIVADIVEELLHRRRRELVGEITEEAVERVRSIDAREELVKEIAEQVLSEIDGRYQRMTVPPQHGTLASVTVEDVPLGVSIESSIDAPVTYAISPREGFFAIGGVRSFNDPGEIWVRDLRVQGRLVSQCAHGFDSASWSLTHGAFRDAPVDRHLAYYRADWGCIDFNHPLCVTFGPPPGSHPSVPYRLQWTLYGIWFEAPAFGSMELEVERR